jgi:hypothetical protein
MTAARSGCPVVCNGCHGLLCRRDVMSFWRPEMHRSRLLLGLLIAAIAAWAPGAASSRPPSSLTASASPMMPRSLCGSPNPLPAHRLRVPVRTQSCLVGRVVAFHSVRERVPARPKVVCASAIEGTIRYRLCVVDNGDRLYTITTSVPLPAACLVHGTIPARLLRVPVPRNLCDLTKRPVSYKTAGAYIPKPGTTECDIQTFPTYELQLCLTPDSVTAYATYQTFGASSPT